MFTAAITGFITSLAGLVILFSIKYIELSRHRVFAPRLRARADRFARMAKAVLRLLLLRIEQMPYDALVIMRVGVHAGAVLFARAARAAEHGAHSIADRVSHKHRFERSESQSAFLKSVSEHKQSLESKK